MRWLKVYLKDFCQLPAVLRGYLERLKKSSKKVFEIKSEREIDQDKVAWTFIRQLCSVPKICYNWNVGGGGQQNWKISDGAFQRTGAITSQRYLCMIWWHLKEAIFRYQILWYSLNWKRRWCSSTTSLAWNLIGRFYNRESKKSKRLKYSTFRASDIISMCRDWLNNPLENISTNPSEKNKKACEGYLSKIYEVTPRISKNLLQKTSDDQLKALKLTGNLEKYVR